MHLMHLIHFATLIGCFIHSLASTPESIIKAVSNEAFQSDSPSCRFIHWGYGTALFFHSMFYATEHINSMDFQSKISPILDNYLYNDTSSVGYRILHGEEIPFSSSMENAVGDVVGLYPYVYLDRLMYFDRQNKPYKSRADDMTLILRTADHYILQFPRRLPDGTFSRHAHASWNQQDKNASFVWADDNYMGLLLLTHFAKYFHDSSNDTLKQRAMTYALFVADQHIALASHLLYTSGKQAGLFAHGYNFNGNVQSCCPWGRGNAWTFVSAIEALEMLKNFPSLATKRDEILHIFRIHAAAIAKFQHKSGLWHQVVSESSTYLETSGTSGFLTALARGKKLGYLEDQVNLNFTKAVLNAYDGLQIVVNVTSGRYAGSCEGTGIQNDVAGYEQRSTAYCSSGNPGGPGWIIQAVVDYMIFVGKM